MTPRTLALTIVLVLVVGGSVALRLCTDDPRLEFPPVPAAEQVEGGGLRLVRIADLGTAITDVQPARDGSGRLYVTEKHGRVRWIGSDGLAEAPVLDIRDRVSTSGGERGLLGLAFAPDYSETRAIYLNYTAEPDGRTVVSRFHMGVDGVVGDPASEEVLLEIPQPHTNHNAGQLRFGPDGMLWIGTGDGGSGGDPDDRAENPHDLLGKMLRIDVSESEGSGERPYRIPEGNAFEDPAEGRPEIWGIGLRNPWRYSFDPVTRTLWIADVGQGAWEEVNRVTWGTPAGVHFGWDTMEGAHCFEPAEGCDRDGKMLPAYEYSHDEGCSVTGGIVYRGDNLPALVGAYVLSDFCGGWIRALRVSDDGAVTMEELLPRTGLQIVAFGEDRDGELLVADLRGSVYRVEPGSGG